MITGRLRSGEDVVLLVVAESTGSSPGRAGYKMAVARDGSLVGSIGGGVMEVALVEQAKHLLAKPQAATETQFLPQTHRKNTPHASGMICSGAQSVILKRLRPEALEDIIRGGEGGSELAITGHGFAINAREQHPSGSNITFTAGKDGDFLYREILGPRSSVYIIGGGHCALALSELLHRLDLRVHIFDDRPGLNTIHKNEFADEITILASYDAIGQAIPEDPDAYVVVMTLGYKSDALVIRQLSGRDFKYIGVLGSKAKMATLLKELKAEGHDAERLASIRTPIGIPINSHTPEEIAVSIAAEIISVRNA